MTSVAHTPVRRFAFTNVRQRAGLVTASVSEARSGIAHYFTLYNTERPHSSLADQTPDEAYFTPRPHRAAA